MPIYDLFSKRQKRLRGEVPDILSYDKIPAVLKTQIMHIILDTVKESYSDEVLDVVYDESTQILRREYGLYQLAEMNDHYEEDREIVKYFKRITDTEKILDIVELLFSAINTVVRKEFFEDEVYNRSAGFMNPDDAIEELNERFKQHGIGYAFEGNEIIRVDSTYTHSEITKPTITLLWNETFQGPLEEYLKAHEHYRHGRNKECLSECLKAFESTMKVICTEKRWEFDAGRDTVSRLLAICMANNLVPAYMQTQLSSLKALLESGIPTLRNKTSGHGQGATPTVVDDSMARYGLNMTGSSIIFLIEQSGI